MYLAGPAEHFAERVKQIAAGAEVTKIKAAHISDLHKKIVSRGQNDCNRFVTFFQWQCFPAKITDIL
jgi:hypothetical protein